ncbi:hypothetical protein OK074_4994 [Actinobacteria bacterium OK074]|nr:hypothetical protein OK074_4994 [Actinobacteria bacterium OK074]
MTVLHRGVLAGGQGPQLLDALRGKPLCTKSGGSDLADRSDDLPLPSPLYIVAQVFQCGRHLTEETGLLGQVNDLLHEELRSE